MTSKITALFAQVAVALSHLRGSVEAHLFDDQKRAIDEAVVALRDSEDHINEMIAADVAAAVGPAVTVALADFAANFQASVDSLAARLTAAGDDLAAFKAQVEDGLSGLNSAVEELGVPVAGELLTTEGPGEVPPPVAEAAQVSADPTTATDSGISSPPSADGIATDASGQSGTDETPALSGEPPAGEQSEGLAEQAAG